jgi:hypothetical protein
LQPNDAEEQQWDADLDDEAAPAQAAAAAAATSAGHFARYTTAGPAAAAADKPERLKTQAATEGNWKAFLDSSAVLFQSTQIKQAQLQQEYNVFLQQQVTRAVCEGGCSVCGLRVADCRLVRHVEVLVIDIATCCTVQVPVVECTRCGHLPAELGALQAHSMWQQV